jgi:hypothetical protein
MRVEIYRNLHKNTFSIRSVKTGRVIGHADVVEVKNAQFVVRQAGRERVLKESRKNVHAFVRGELVGMYSDVPSCFLSEYMDWKDAYYQPYRCDTFIDYHNLNPVYRADHVILHHGQISYLNNEEAMVV